MFVFANPCGDTAISDYPPPPFPATLTLANGVQVWFGGAAGQPTWVQAIIPPAARATGGTPTNQVRMQLNPPTGGGKAGDDAGHIIAVVLGGPGNVLWNFFPQSSNINRGQWAQQEAICANELRLGRPVRVCFQFHYTDAAYPRRPSAFDYCYKLADGTRLADNLVNP